MDALSLQTHVALLGLCAAYGFSKPAVTQYKLIQQFQLMQFAYVKSPACSWGCVGDGLTKQIFLKMISCQEPCTHDDQPGRCKAAGAQSHYIKMCGELRCRAACLRGLLLQLLLLRAVTIPIGMLLLASPLTITIDRQVLLAPLKPHHCLARWDLQVQSHASP